MFAICFDGVPFAYTKSEDKAKEIVHALKLTKALYLEYDEKRYKAERNYDLSIGYLAKLQSISDTLYYELENKVPAIAKELDKKFNFEFNKLRSSISNRYHFRYRKLENLDLLNFE